MPDQDTPPELSSEEIELIRKRRANPMMAAGLDLVMQRFDEEISKDVDAHQAEESALKLLQQLGQTMLGQWAQHTESEQLTKAQRQDPTLQKHAKKTLLVHHPRSYRARGAGSSLGSKRQDHLPL